jgi:heme exporter protein A
MFGRSQNPLIGKPGAPAMAIQAAGLCRRYQRRWVLVDVGLEVPWGSVWMVAGHNGAGKSTLLRILGGAIRPDLGAGTVAGWRLVHDRQAVRRSSALLGHSSGVYPSLSALENLRIAARFLGRDAGRRPLLEHLERVGLAERADDPVATFSAGMRKRAALALVLLKDAPVVLLDEPYGELDPAGFHFVDDVVRELRGRGATVLVATHLLERGAELCDRALLLDHGRLVWSGPAAEVPDPALRRPAVALAEAGR